MIKNVRKAIFALLQADSTVSSIVVSGSQTRIYPIQLAQGVTAPSLVYHVVSENTDYNISHSSGLVMSRIQIDAYALTQSVAFDLADAVKDVLSGFRGIVAYGSNSPQDTITIRGIFGDNGRDLFTDASKLYSFQRDYLVWFAEFGTA